MKKTFKQDRAKNVALGLAIVSSFALYTPHAFAVAPTAMPTGGAVAAGTAAIGAVTNPTTTPVMNITQDSERAVINWATFNVGKDGTVNFVQKFGPESATLNVVAAAGGLSEVAGKINANGSFALYNPNGMIFYKGSEVHTGGFLATTAEVDTEKFMKEYENNTDTTKMMGSIKFKTKKTGSANASVVMDGVVTSQMNDARFYDDTLNTGTPYNGVLGGIKPATTFSPINNKIWLVADGNVRLGANSSLTADTTTVPKRTTAVGEEEYGVDTISMTANGQVKISADANTDNYVEKDYTLNYTDPTAPTYTENTYTTNADNPVSATNLVAAQIKADAGYKIYSNISAYEAATIIDAKASVDALTGRTGTGLTYIQKNYNSGSLTSQSYTSYVTNNTTGVNEAAGTVAATSSNKHMLINDVYELQAIDPNLNIVSTSTGVVSYGNLAGTYALGEEIDASDTVNWNGGKGFTPIGKNGTTISAFTGKISGVPNFMKSSKKDGSDNTASGYLPTTPITGLTIKLGETHVGDASTDYAGLIAKNGGTLTALEISANVTGDEYVGIAAGYNYGSLNQVYASGSVLGHTEVGGLAGRNQGGTVYLSSASGTVTATGDKAGGIFGESYGGSIANEVSNSATVKGVNYVGGYIGYSDGTTIGGNGWRAGNYGTVTATENFAGGVAGYMNNGYVDRVYNGGTVTGDSNVGGIVGQTDGSTYIDEVMNYGNVTGDSNVGGLVGQHDSSGAITSSYNGDTMHTTGIPGIPVTEATFTYNGLTYTWDPANEKFTADKHYSYDSAWVFAAENWTAAEITTINARVDGSSVTDSKGVTYTYRGTTTDGRWEAVKHMEYKAEDPVFNPTTGLMDPGRTAAEVLGQALANDDYYGFTYGGKVYKYDLNAKMYTEYAIDGTTPTGNTYSDEEMTGYTDGGGVVHTALAPMEDRVYTVRPTFQGANVSGKGSTGGLVGTMTNGSISNAYNVGKITDLDTTIGNDTGALVGTKIGSGTVDATNVYWVDATGRDQADYAYTTEVDWKDNHMSGVEVGIGNTGDTTGKIDLNKLEGDPNVNDVLGASDKGTKYQYQITPLISSYLTGYTFERNKEYNGLVNSLRTDDVGSLFGAGRFNYAEVPGVGKNVLNSATTKDATPFAQDDGSTKPKVQAEDADGNLLYYQADGTVGTTVTTDPAYYLFETDTGHVLDSNGNDVEYTYSKYTFDQSDLWSTQLGYKTKPINYVAIKPRPLAITVFGSHEYGEAAVTGTNPIANVVSPDNTKYSIYANILGYNETFEDVIVGNILYKGTDIFTGLKYVDEGNPANVDSPTMNAGSYVFGLGTKNGQEDVTNGFSGKTALNGNYVLTYKGTLDITKAPLTVNIDDQTKIYGDANPAIAGTLTGWKNGENETTALGASGGFFYTVDNPLNPNSLTNAGVYADAITHNYSFANYDTTTTTRKGTLTILKADLTYTPNDQNKIYGQLNPDLTTVADYSDKGAFVGWKGNDTYNALHNGTVTGALTLSTAANQQTDAGDYDIVANSNLDFTNYNVIYNPGTLTINKADLEYNASGEHYMGAPIGVEDFNLTAVAVSGNTTTDQINDGKLKSWDAASASNIKTLTGFHRDGTDDLILYMTDKDGNRSIINNLTEMKFDADGNIIGYKLLDGSFRRADGTYQLMSKNYVLKFKASDDGNFIVDYPNGPMTAVYNAAATSYNDWDNDRHGTVRYLTVKGTGIKH